MKYDYKQTLLSKALLSGLLAGLAAVLINFIFNFVYREISDFALSEVINVTSLIFGSMIAVMIGSIIYYMLAKMSSGTIIYIVLFLALTAFGAYGAMQTNRTDLPSNEHDFRILFGGIIVITGLCAALLVPYFYKNDTIYNETNNEVFAESYGE